MSFSSKIVNNTALGNISDVKPLLEEKYITGKNSTKYTPSYISASEDELCSSNFSDFSPNKSFSDRIDELSKGLSRFEYKGVKFDVYKNNQNVKTQFVYPKSFDKEDFFNKFPSLKCKTYEPITEENITEEQAVEIEDIKEEDVITDVIEEDATTEDVEENIITENDEENNKEDDSVETNIKGVNGEIDEYVRQGITGDCWLLSSVISISSTEEGKQAIKDSIIVNKDSVTVNFKGANVSYDISADEINKYDTDDNKEDKYSNGDNDMLVLELAVEKLWNDIRNGDVVLPNKNSDLSYTADGTGIAGGGLAMQMTYYLTGVMSEEHYNHDMSEMSQEKVFNALNNAMRSKSPVLNFTLNKDIHSAELMNGNIYSIDLGQEKHCFAVTDITEDSISFKNPWDKDDVYTLSWDEFAKLGVSYITLADLG